MEEPLLAAVIPDKPEASVANESFDCAACHASLLGRTSTLGDTINFYSETGDWISLRIVTAGYDGLSLRDEHDLATLLRTN